MIGAAIKRKEDPRFITGEGKYTADVQLMGMACMMVLRSPHAHARITRIDASRALQRPDVLKVLTGPEVIQHCKTQFLTIGEAGGTKPKSSWPMAAELATYVGEPVAAVLATSIDAATDAVEMIDVDYEPLPAVVDMEKAAEEGSPLVHEDLDTNVCIDASRTVGDPDRAFREADGVVSLRLEQPRLVPNPMEPRAVVASYEPGTGNLTLWLSTQAPHLERSSVSEILGFPENKLRIIAADVGGGFGCKMDTYPETIVAAILSMQLARPVKWVESRQEHFISTVQGHGELQYVEAGYKKDGTLLGMRLRYYNDMGAYCWGSAPNVVESFATSGAQGAYKVKNLAWTTYGLYTNKVPVGPYRGYGQHATAYFVERVMDLIARDLKMDPVEVRLKNFISRDEFPYQTPTGGVYDSGDYEAVLSPNPPKDTDGRREGSGRGWVRELQGRWPGLLG